MRAAGRFVKTRQFAQPWQGPFGNGGNNVYTVVADRQRDRGNLRSGACAIDHVLFAVFLHDLVVGCDLKPMAAERNEVILADSRKIGSI
jgi:hypothetical protein